MTRIIGGKADGHQAPVKLPRLELDGEVYMLVSYRDDDNNKHVFYLLAGMKPTEALKIFKERLLKERLKK